MLLKHILPLGRVFGVKAHRRIMMPFRKPIGICEGICEAIDDWRIEHPELTIMEILRALEEIRSKLTEGMIEHD